MGDHNTTLLYSHPMDSTTAPQKVRRSRYAGLKKLLIGILALVGVFALAWHPTTQLLFGWMYVTEVHRPVLSPDGLSGARIEVRKGGMGTVHTTRVILTSWDNRNWTIYEAGDSDFQPSLRWTASDTLFVGLGCGRFDHVSNPDDWQRSDPAEPRLKVRFEYREPCA